MKYESNIIAMKPQQKQKRPPDFTQTPTNQPTISMDLRKLVDLWLNNSVDDFYQNKVMSYLDQFQNKQIQLRQIKKEIQLTLKKQSIFFMIRHLLQEKDKLVESLNKQIQTLQKYSSLDNQEEPDLEPVCNILNDLRQSHMLIVEAIMQFMQKYKIKNQRSSPEQNEGQQTSILACISTDIAFLKQSVLKYYMPFAQEIEPLFVEQSRSLKKNYKDNKIVYNKHIEKLLTLTPSHMYRLLRAKKNIDRLIVMESEKQDNYQQANQKSEQKQVQNTKDILEQHSDPESQHSVPLNLRTIQHEKSFTTQPKSQKILQSKKIVLSFKLDNSVYMMNQMKPKSRANTRNETIQMFQQKYISNTELPQGLSQLTRNQSRQNQNKREYDIKLRNKHLKFEAKEVEVLVGQFKHITKLKLTPPVLKIDIKSEIKDKNEISSRRNTLTFNSQQKNIAHKQISKYKDEGVQHSPIEIISKNKRFYLLELEKDSIIIEEDIQPYYRKKKQTSNRINDQKSRPRRLQSIDSFQQNKKIRQQQDMKFNRNKSLHIGNFGQPIDHKELNQIQFRETHKNLLTSFQKNHNNPKRLKNEPKYDQRYIQHDNKRQQLTEEQHNFLQRQKQLIAKINKKYKQLAMKEKEYELSKIGHNIYHRMKEKMNYKQKVSPTRKYKSNILHDT